MLMLNKMTTCIDNYQKAKRAGGNRMMRKTRMIAAVLLGALMLQAGPLAASETLTGYLDSIAILIENDAAQTNQEAIMQLLELAEAEVEPGSAAASALTGLKALISSGTTEKETLLTLLAQVGGQASGGETEAAETDNTGVPETVETEDTQTAQMQHEGTGLPEYVSEDFLWKLLSENASLQVPENWYSNDSGASLVNYSDVSESGHISPAGGTLTTNYYAAEAGNDESAAIEEYADNLSKMKMVSDFRQEDLTLAGLPARHMIYSMAAGANDFTCDSLCVDYNGTVYSVQVTQGAKSSFDYFPMFDNAVNSLTFGEEAVNLVKQQETEAPQPQTETSKPETEMPQPQTETTKPETEMPQPQTEALADAAADGLASFTYSIDGTAYSFPTNVSDLTQASAWMDLNAEIEYKLKADANLGGLWTEISNTEYIFLTSTLYQEMIGVTNMSERDITMKEGIVTTLVDTEGDSLSLTLPGEVKVGASEETVGAAYPAFDQLEWDGNAGFIGDREMIFAKNIRDDGCRGYAFVRGDAPYYSALTIICENGIIREICFECLGSKKAGAIFS